MSHFNGGTFKIAFGLKETSIRGGRRTRVFIDGIVGCRGYVKMRSAQCCGGTLVISTFVDDNRYGACLLCSRKGSTLVVGCRRCGGDRGGVIGS